MLSALGSSLEAYLTALANRQRVVSSNIANADTPGYRARDIDFRNALQQAAGNRTVSTVEVSGLAVKPDGNTVSVDREARLLAENALRFSIGANLVRSEVRSVRMAIQEKGA